MRVPKVCPQCGDWIPNNHHPGAYRGAMSRRDGEEICTACGVREAFEDFAPFMEDD